MSKKLTKLLNAGFVSVSLLASTTVPGSLGGLAVTRANATDNHDTNYIKIAQSAIGSSRTINLGLNKSIVVDLPGDAHDILVANPQIADAITRTSRRIYIFAKQVGQTNLFIFDSAGKQLLNLNLLVERDITSLEAYIKKYVPDSDVTVEMMNDNVVLTGTVPTPIASSRVASLAQIFVTGGEATTNAYNVDGSPGGGGGGGGGGDGASINFGDNETRRTSKIVNLLRIEGEDQVNLKVTVAEIQRTIVKQLGVDLSASHGTTFQVVSDNPLALGNALGTLAKYTRRSGDDTVSGLLHAMSQAGVMRTLAEPTLTAISGETAYFKVGGEYNIPNGRSSSGTDGEVTYAYKEVEYGISLAFSPVVLSPGRISLKIKTQVSEPTSEGLGGVPRTANTPASPIPGIRRREAETSIELPSGGSMVIAGLLRDDVRQVSTGFPGLKNLPILGTLFRSRDYQRMETELVIIATPYLVRPVARKDLARPDDNFAAASDGAADFLGRVNRVYGRVEGDIPDGRYHGNVGFIYK